MTLTGAVSIFANVFVSLVAGFGLLIIRGIRDDIHELAKRVARLESIAMGQKP